jgi:hypothetical protein
MSLFLQGAALLTHFRSHLFLNDLADALIVIYRRA